MNRLKKYVKKSMVLNSFNRRFLDELDMYQITKLLIEMKDAANLEDTIHDTPTKKWIVVIRHPNKRETN